MKLFLLPAPSITLDSNRGSLWGAISERTHWFRWWGWKVMRGLKGEAEILKEWEQSCTFGSMACWLWVSPRSQAKTSTHFLRCSWRCTTGPMPGCAFTLLRVQTRVNTSFKSFLWFILHYPLRSSSFFFFFYLQKMVENTCSLRILPCTRILFLFYYKRMYRCP